MKSYATESDLESWYGEALPGAKALLRDASIEIDSLLIGAIYDTDEDGLPTDPRVRNVLRDATCAQAAWVGETGGTQTPSSFGSLRFDGPSLSESGASSTAILILSVEGLLDNSPGVAR